VCVRVGGVGFGQISTPGHAGVVVPHLVAQFLDGISDMVRGALLVVQVGLHVRLRYGVLRVGRSCIGI